MRKKRIGLVVDNPQRDLEGLVLVAAHLAKSGFKVLLIPMYKQSFVVKHEDVDIIIINYLRKNNLNTFLDFKRKKKKVVVLDTEGVGGRDFEEFAELVSQTKMAHLIDLYMFWGSGQMDAVVKRGLIKPEKGVVTGCPRYDYVAEPWLRSIEDNTIQGNFILFNTNFPIVNPKFSRGKGDEYKTLLNVGFGRKLAEGLIDQNMTAYSGMKALIKSLATKMPMQTFVLRPHPFEDISGYDDLAEFSNIKVIQHGSANSWIFKSACMVHLNCSTAVEAAMMGKLVVSPAWLNDSAIYRPLPTALSHSVNSSEKMLEVLSSAQDSSGWALTSPVAMVPALIRESFHDIDGKSASRVTEAIIELADRAVEPMIVQKRTISIRLKNILRDISDKRMLWQVKEKLKNLNKTKYFTSDNVIGVLERLGKVEPAFSKLSVKDIHRAPNSRAWYSDIVAVSVENVDIRDGKRD